MRFNIVRNTLKGLKLVLVSSLLLSGCDFNEQKKPSIPEHIGIEQSTTEDCKGDECKSSNDKVKFYDLKLPDEINEEMETSSTKEDLEKHNKVSPEVEEAIRVNALIEKKKQKAEKDLLEAKKIYEEYTGLTTDNVNNSQ